MDKTPQRRQTDGKSAQEKTNDDNDGRARCTAQHGPQPDGDEDERRGGGTSATAGPRSRAAAALGDGLVASHEPPPALPGEPSGQVPRGYRGAGNCVPTKSCTSNSHLTHSCQSLDATRRPSGGSNPGPSRLGTRVGAKENRAIRSRAARGSPGRALPGEGSRANRLQTV